MKEAVICFIPSSSVLVQTLFFLFIVSHSQVQVCPSRNLCLPLSIILDKKKPDWFWVGKSQEVKQWNFWLPIHVNSFQSHSTWILFKLTNPASWWHVLQGYILHCQTPHVKAGETWKKRQAKHANIPLASVFFASDLGQRPEWALWHALPGFSPPIRGIFHNRWPSWQIHTDVLKAIPVKLQRFHEVTPSSQLSHHLGFLVFCVWCFF